MVVFAVNKGIAEHSHQAQMVVDKSKGTQEGGVMASKKLQKSFSHHAPLRIGQEQGNRQR